MGFLPSGYLMNTRNPLAGSIRTGKGQNFRQKGDRCDIADER